MYLTGFADEAADSIDGQIAATRELGWQWIEARKCGGANIHDIPDAEFERAADALRAAGVGINCFGSAIANWAKPIDRSGEDSLAEARRAIPRMRRLGTTLVRIMSYAVRRDAAGAIHADQMEEERFRRLRELVALFRDAGITPLHENCATYGGMGWSFTRRMLDAVPGLKLVFDTGNPTKSEDVAAGAGADGRHPLQSAWDFYRNVREHIAYVHIKDGRIGADGKHVHTWPGEGAGEVRRIVKDLVQRGYDGGFSMEPHLAVVHHDPSITSSAAIRHANYVEYGRRFAALLAGEKGEIVRERAATAPG
jgi:sugar phosphate isomerase/epimerase